MKDTATILREKGFLPDTDGVGWVRKQGVLVVRVIPAGDKLDVSLSLPLVTMPLSGGRLSLHSVAGSLEECLDELCTELKTTAARIDDYVRVAIAALRSEIYLEKETNNDNDSAGTDRQGAPPREDGATTAEDAVGEILDNAPLVREEGL